MRSRVRKYRLEIAWVVWAAANVVVTFLVAEYETVPFHFVWISLTLMYGYRIWRLNTALFWLGCVCVVTGVSLGYAVSKNIKGLDELTEVPLMAVVFLAMVWHVERRQAALAAVQRAAEREREFVRAASHHLKTPIAIARGVASLMRTDLQTAVTQVDLDDLIEELDRLGNLAENLLMLATAEQPDSLVFDDVDLEDLVTSAARRWSRTANRRWTVKAADGIIIGDRSRLDLVLDALLDNALHATKPGDLVAIEGRTDAAHAVISITDSGAGIDADALPHVFERFWSASSTNGNGRRSTGLGLPIVKGFVTAHGGSVDVVSTSTVGTTVTIRLPLQRAAVPARV
jgi:two-component system, OmpR family, sensor kinase